jgi:hypothetical protein
MGTGGPFPEGKALLVRDADHSPRVVPRSKMGMSYTSSVHWSLHDGSGTAFNKNSFNLNIRKLKLQMKATKALAFEEEFKKIYIQF